MGWVSEGKRVTVVCDRCGIEGRTHEPGKHLKARTKSILWARLQGWAISPKNDIAYCVECRPPSEKDARDFTPTRWDKILKG